MRGDEKFCESEYFFDDTKKGGSPKKSVYI